MIEDKTFQNILSQEEIDALLNPPEDVAALLGKSSAKIPSQQKNIFPEWAKKLDVFSRALTTALRQFTEAEEISVEIDTFISGSLASYLSTLQNPSLLGSFIEKDINVNGLFYIDSVLAISIIDMALGGNRGTTAMQINGRPYTQIEKNIIKTLMQAVLKGLSDTLQMSFDFDCLETNPQTARIESPTCQMYIARLSVRFRKKVGIFDVALPLLIVKQIEKQALEQSNPLLDSWKEDLYTSCEHIPLEITAVIDEKKIPFKTILQWKEGQSLPLSFFEDKAVQLRCNGVPLFWGRLNPNKTNISIAIQKKEET